MRADNFSFKQKNTAKSKEPRYTIEIAFDSANTILWYFTSHTDAAYPVTTNVITNVVEGLSGTSQQIYPDEARSTIGSLSFSLVDKSSQITSRLSTELTLGRSTRKQRVRVYMGFEGLAWADYVQIPSTNLVGDISYKDGVYTVRCHDIQREMRKDIFDPATTTLSATLTDSATTVEVYATSAFSMVAHGTSYSDAPSSTVGYIKIENEIIRYTGKTATTFTGCTRGALNTKAVEHKVDSTVANDRKTAVTEYIYLEMPAPKLAYALLTGQLYGQAATLPTKWHLGISTAYVKQADFTGVGLDLWNTANDEQGFVVRFEGPEKTDGKAFIEKELCLLMGAFMPVYTDGSLGLRRMASVLAGSAYVAQLDETNIVEYSDLTHDHNGLHNQIQIDWNWEPSKKAFTRTTLLIDSDSTAIYGSAPVYKAKFRGLHGSRHASTILESRFAAFRDRYTGPPQKITVKCLPSLNTLEVGDVVRLKLANVRDFVTNGSLDRSFEIQSTNIDWINGNVSLTLFASSRAAAPPSTISAVTALNDSFYTSTGTALSSVLTITGSAPGHVSASGSITGNADMNAAGAIYYYAGDLVIDAGVVVTISQNVQLRIRGYLTINGSIDGIGNGLTGATAPAAACNALPNSCTSYLDDVTYGTTGFIGPTKSGGAAHIEQGLINYSAARSPVEGYFTNGLTPTAYPVELTNTGSALTGIPSDLRGTSGGSGAVSSAGFQGYEGADRSAWVTATAGNGGNGGAGLAIICRGLGWGVSGAINLSGAPGSAGTSLTYTLPGGGDYYLYSGSGAGGAPGALYVFLDGSGVAVPDIDQVTATFGISPAPPSSTRLENIVYGGWGGLDYYGNNVLDPGTYHSYYVGFGGADDYPAPDLSGSNGAVRVQYIPANATASVDPDSLVLSAPSGFTVESGTNALFVNGDGTVVSRIKCTWTPPTDSRVLAYDIQFKPSADTEWPSAITLFGSTTNLAYLTPVKDAVSYDIRIRSVGDIRQTSAWVTISGHTVIGKTEPPSDVPWLSVGQNGNEVAILWGAVNDADLFGYEIRYHPVGTPSWDNGVLLTRATKGTQILTSMVPTGSWTFLIKALDTSRNTTTSSGRNESVNATSFDADVTTDFDVIEQSEQAPSWLGVISAVGDQLLLEDGTSFALLEDGDFAMLESATNTFVRHWTGVLLPESTKLASEHTNAELFEQFVPYAQPECIYESPEFNLDFDSPVRVWGDIRSELGRGATGIASPDLQIDYRMQSGVYDGWENWGAGNVNARYVKHRVVLTTAEGKAKITGFLPTVDSLERTETQNVTVGASGTTVTFLEPFHVNPKVAAFNTGSAPLTPTVTAVTTTSCVVHLYDSTATAVSGTARVEAKGV